MMGFWDAVASVGPYANNLQTSLQTDNHTNTSSLSFYNPDALPDAQPTVSKHSTIKSHKNNFPLLHITHIN